MYVLIGSHSLPLEPEFNHLVSSPLPVLVHKAFQGRVSPNYLLDQLVNLLNDAFVLGLLDRRDLGWLHSGLISLRNLDLLDLGFHN